MGFNSASEKKKTPEREKKKSGGENGRSPRSEYPLFYPVGGEEKLPGFILWGV